MTFRYFLLVILGLSLLGYASAAPPIIIISTATNSYYANTITANFIQGSVTANQFYYTGNVYGSNGVLSLNGLTGNVNLIAGPNALIYTSGQNIVIDAIKGSGGGGVTTLNGLSGVVNIASANSNIIVSTSGQNIILTGNSIPGPQGPTGGTGATGPTGSTGPAGPAGTNGIIYTFNAPLSANAYNVVSISQASASSSGFLSSSDWGTFNTVRQMAFAFTTTGLLQYSGNAISCPNCQALVSQGTGISLSALNVISNLNISLSKLFVSAPLSLNSVYGESLLLGSMFTTNSAGYLLDSEYNSLYLTSTYNSIYAAKFDTAGTGLASTGTTVSLAPLTAGTGIIIGANGNTITATGYNSAYWTGTNYNALYFPYPALTSGTGIIVSSGNTITATGYNSAYWTGSNYNSVYFPYSTLTGGTGIVLTTANTLTATGYNSAYWTGTNYNSAYLSSLTGLTYFPYNTLTAGTGIVLTTANTLTATGYNSVYLTSQIFGVNSLNGLGGAVTLIGVNGLTTYTSGQNDIISISNTPRFTSVTSNVTFQTLTGTGANTLSVNSIVSNNIITANEIRFPGAGGAVCFHNDNLGNVVITGC